MNINKKAHNTLTTFNRMCDDYNDTGFIDLSAAMLKNYQDWAKDSLTLFKFLDSKESNEASRAYLTFNGKILLRLSYLIHLDRIETNLETHEYFKDFNKEVSHETY